MYWCENVTVPKSHLNPRCSFIWYFCSWSSHLRDFFSSVGWSQLHRKLFSYPKKVSFAKCLPDKISCLPSQSTILFSQGNLQEIFAYLLYHWLWPVTETRKYRTTNMGRSLGSAVCNSFFIVTFGVSLPYQYRFLKLGPRGEILLGTPSLGQTPSNFK